MTDRQTIPVSEAKGRPMLQWVGKRPLDYVTAFPAQLVERFDLIGNRPPAAGGKSPEARATSSSTVTTRTCWPGCWPTATAAR